MSSARARWAGALMIIGVVDFFAGVGHAGLLLSISEVETSRWEFPLWAPASLVADSKGVVYAGSAIGQRVQAYGPDGTFLRAMLVPTTKGDFTLGVDDQDRLWLQWAKHLYGWEAGGALFHASSPGARPDQSPDQRPIRWDPGEGRPAVAYHRGGLLMLPLAFPWTALLGVVLVVLGAALNPKQAK